MEAVSKAFDRVRFISLPICRCLYLIFCAGLYGVGETGEMPVIHPKNSWKQVLFLSWDYRERLAGSHQHLVYRAV